MWVRRTSFGWLPCRHKKNVPCKPNRSEWHGSMIMALAATNLARFGVAESWHVSVVSLRHGWSYHVMKIMRPVDRTSHIFLPRRCPIDMMLPQVDRSFFSPMMGCKHSAMGCSFHFPRWCDSIGSACSHRQTGPWSHDACHVQLVRIQVKPSSQLTYHSRYFERLCSFSFPQGGKVLKSNKWTTSWTNCFHFCHLLLCLILSPPLIWRPRFRHVF